MNARWLRGNGIECFTSWCGFFKLFIMGLQYLELTYFFISPLLSAVPAHTKSRQSPKSKPRPPSHTHIHTYTHSLLSKSSAMPKGLDEPAAHSEKPCLFTPDPWGRRSLSFDLSPVKLGTTGNLFSIQPGEALQPSQEPQPRAALTGKLSKERK